MKVFINADDFGLSSDVNKAIALSFENKYIQQTTMLVNMPLADEAAIISKEMGFFNSVGLHLNLVTGCPLTEGIKKTTFCTGDYFNGSIMQGNNRFILNREKKVAIIDEIQAQIDKYLMYGFTLRHLDSHRHSHTNPSILSILLSLLEKNGFCSIRLSRNLKSMGISKDTFKLMENMAIESYNKKRKTRYTDCRYFGTLSDFDILPSKKIKSSIELMVHPIMNSGAIKDSINTFGIGEWIESKQAKGIQIN